MSNDRYGQIFEDLTRDLLSVAKRHGKRALREAVRDAAKGNLIQEDSAPPDKMEYPDEGVLVIPVSSDAEEEIGEEENTTEEESSDDGIPPEDLEYPDESVWTLPPAPDDEEEGSDSGDDGDEQSAGDEQSTDDELSDAAQKVAAELAERLERRMRK